MAFLPPSTVFPNFTDTNHKVTSPRTPEYNCIAWAAGDASHWWWPAPGYYWPDGISRQETIDSFKDAFATLGYVLCASYDREQGFEKVALYAINGKPTHMARQLPDGRWASKLGNSYDIEHLYPEVVDGALYGMTVLAMKRAI